MSALCFSGITWGRVATTSICALTALAVPGVALAGAGLVTTNVETLTQNVTYSRVATTKTPALTTYIAYKVTVGSDASNTNTINNVRFTGTATATDAQEKPEFSSADGATCFTTNTSKNAIECTIGQLRAGQTYPSFIVFFKAPIKDTVSPTADGDNSSPPVCNGDCVQFAGITYYAEGTGGPTSPPQNSTVIWNATAKVALGTANPMLVKTGVQKNGGSIYTGDGAPTSADTFATSLSVPVLPTGNSFGFAELAESVPGPTNPCPSGVTCLNLVDVTVKNQEIGGQKLRFDPVVVTDPLTQYLVIKLRLAATVFQGSINSVNVYYLLESTNTYIPIPPCSNGADPLLGVDRCVLDRRVLKKNDAEVKANPDLAGVPQVTLLARENGRIAW